MKAIQERNRRKYYVKKNTTPVILDDVFNMTKTFQKKMGYDLEYVQILSSCQPDFYKEYQIPKKNGKKRIIHELFPNLKDFQYWILDNILKSEGVLRKVSSVATAFMPNVSIKDNTGKHIGKHSLVCMDLKDFFSNVHQIEVYSIFKVLGYGKDVAGMLSHLCTLNDVLLQGAPLALCFQIWQ